MEIEIAELLSIGGLRNHDNTGDIKNGFITEAKHHFLYIFFDAWSPWSP